MYCIYRKCAANNGYVTLINILIVLSAYLSANVLVEPCVRCVTLATLFLLSNGIIIAGQ